MTDTQGLLLAIEVHAANEHDSKSGGRVLKLLKYRFGRVEKIYANGSYRGELIETIKKELVYQMKITLRTDKSKGFKPLPKRWVIERSFACLEDFRRLAKDYERTVEAAQNMICLAFISLMMT